MKLLNGKGFNLQDIVYSWDLMLGVESKIKGLFDHGSCVAVLVSEEVLYPLGLPETGELIFNKQSFHTRQEKYYVKDVACFHLYPK